MPKQTRIDGIKLGKHLYSISESVYDSGKFTITRDNEDHSDFQVLESLVEREEVENFAVQLFSICNLSSDVITKD